MKVIVIPIGVDVLGMVSKVSAKRQEELEIRERIKTRQTAALSRLT